MEINPKKYYTGEEVENLIKNSVAKYKRRVIENWKKGMKLVVIITMVGTVFVTALVSMIANKIGEKKAINEALANYDDTEIVAVVKDAEQTYRAPGKKEYVKNHDTDQIADYLINDSENFHEDLYLAAKKIDEVSEYTDADVENVVDRVLVSASNINDESNPNNVLDYESWKDYCLKHGFVDEKGEPSLEAYMSEMTQNMVNKAEGENFEEEHGLGSGR